MNIKVCETSTCGREGPEFSDIQDILRVLPRCCTDGQGYHDVAWNKRVR